MKGTPHRDEWGRPRLRWASAVLISLAVHALAAVLVLAQVDALPPSEEQVVAVMIVTEPAPQLAGTEDAAMPPPSETLEAETGEETELMREEPVEEEIVPEPEQADEALPDPVDPPVEDAEIPLPTRRPEPPRRTADAPGPGLRERETDSVAVMPETDAPPLMSLRSEEGDPAAALGNVPGPLADRGAVESWQARLMAHLERRKRYPSTARGERAEGTAMVRFRMDGAGNVLVAELVRSAGNGALDSEALGLVRRSSPLPEPPPGMNTLITVPIRFSIR